MKVKSAFGYALLSLDSGKTKVTEQKSSTMHRPTPMKYPINRFCFPEIKKKSRCMRLLCCLRDPPISTFEPGEKILIKLHITIISLKKTPKLHFLIFYSAITTPTCGVE